LIINGIFIGQHPFPAGEIDGLRNSQATVRWVAVSDGCIFWNKGLIMSTEDAVQPTEQPTGGKLQKSTPTAIAEAGQIFEMGRLPGKYPVMKSNVQVLAESSLPNGRPVFVSHIKVREDAHLPHNRPVYMTDVRVVRTDSLPHNRPVFEDEIKMVPDFGIMGRPIGISDIPVPEYSPLPNNRPIAHNNQDYEDIEVIIGYLD